MLSIIVAVLNEALGLPTLLDRLLPLRRHGCEVLFVDGGSTDKSVAVLVTVNGMSLVFDAVDSWCWLRGNRAVPHPL